MSQPVWMNYIKPRTSNLTNTNASIITIKRQSQMVFTGYARQIAAINGGFKTQRKAIVFNGADGPALANLKQGNTWTDPLTLYAIQTTIYDEDYVPPNKSITFTSSNIIPGTTILNFSNYPLLKKIDISNISTIQSIESFGSRIEYIDISNSSITNIDNFPSSIEYIDISGTSVISIENLANFSKLTTLYINGTNITSLPPILPDALQALDISNTSITNLPLQLPSQLEYLDISNNVV
jgi:Leucine-rich repeat (LRR) protein